MNPPATHTHPYSITPREINFEGTALKSHVYFLVKHYILKAQSYYIYYDIKKKNIILQLICIPKGLSLV